MSETGIIFNIQRFSLHDGPGIRTLIFIKGCPLRCKWCSNPEGLSAYIEVGCDNQKCMGCGVCALKCPNKAVTPTCYSINRDQCVRCGNCVKFCPTGSKFFYGEEMSVSDVISIVKRDMPFYTDNEGGVTVGGGEMLSQPDFSFEILNGCKELNINTAIETSGFGKKEDLLKIAEVSDTIYFDIKALCCNLHKDITGADNKIILDNLKALDEKLLSMSPKPALILRVPLVEGYNATTKNASEIVHFIKHNLSAYDAVELMVFHNLGEHKYALLNLPYELKGRINAREEDISYLKEIMEQQGLKVKVSKF